MVPFGFSSNPQTGALQQAALSPYAGAAPGGGTAGAVQQLAAALMARQRMQQEKSRLGVPQYGLPTAQPGQVTPGSPGVGLGGQAQGFSPFLAPQALNAQQVTGVNA